MGKGALRPFFKGHSLKKEKEHEKKGSGGCEITQTQITKEVHRLFRVSGPPFVVKFT